MYYFLALLVGVVISVMVSLNNGLTQAYGAYGAAVIVHVVGVVFALALCLIKKEKPFFKKKIPLWAYGGGAIGVLTTISNNYAFRHISLTNIVALGLLGQSIASIVLDTTGWMGMQRRPLKSTAMAGYIPAMAGIFLMIDPSAANASLAVILSLAAGVAVVLSRTVNARLSRETSPLVGSFINHLVGLPICVVLAVLLQRPLSMTLHSGKPWIFFGGALGVVTVLLFNVTVPKLSAFRLTLLSFTGQVFTGILLDLALGQGYSKASFIGGMFVVAGLALNMALDQWRARNKRREDRYWESIQKAEQAHWEKVLGGRDCPEPCDGQKPAEQLGK